MAVLQNTVSLLAGRIYYLSLIFLVTVNSQAFSALACEDFARSRYSTSVNDAAKSYRQLLTRLAQSSLKVKELNPQQIKALEHYYSVVQGETGKDGTFARADNYTVGQRRKIIKYLEDQGFSREQVRRLIEDGIVEINRVTRPKLNTRRILNNINELKPVFAANSARSVKVNKVERTDHNLLVKIERIDPKTGELLTEDVIIPLRPSELLIETLLIEAGWLVSPEFELVFTAARSTRKKVDSKDLKLPPPTNEETKLLKQDYKASYTRGLDQVNEWAYVRRRLQELKANPRITHIEYFANQIPDHIAHIKRGFEESYLESHFFGSKSKQLQHLESLEVEAKKAIADKKVTYQWWIEFNHKLSTVMAGAHPENRADRGMIEDVVSDFPLKIIIPTTIEDIGIMAFNISRFEGVYPASVSNKNNNSADATQYTSSAFFAHDVEHSIFNGNRLYMDYSMSHRLLHKRLLDNMESLPPNKRKKAERVYFIMTHESDINILNSDLTLKEVKIAIMEDISGVFKLSDDPAQKQKKLEDLADTFMEVYNQAQQHQ
ncbi:MAG: hypothetical protein F4X95_03180 [Oligoflexia bacterium]|nr:hypothetical protein [Oligoflexia bacterium]